MLCGGPSWRQQLGVQFFGSSSAGLRHGLRLHLRVSLVVAVGTAVGAADVAGAAREHPAAGADEDDDQGAKYAGTNDEKQMPVEVVSVCDPVSFVSEHHTLHSLKGVGQGARQRQGGVRPVIWLVVVYIVYTVHGLYIM